VTPIVGKDAVIAPAADDHPGGPKQAERSRLLGRFESECLNDPDPEAGLLGVLATGVIRTRDAIVARFDHATDDPETAIALFKQVDLPALNTCAKFLHLRQAAKEPRRSGGPALG
jgi:hypothetical protein